VLLRLADNLKLPYEAVTQTIAILGMRGSGKTTTGVVLTEEMVKPGLPVVVFDPVGVWWGLRASADGKGVGLPVLIAGGYQGDVPLSAEAGEALARLVVEELVPQRRSLVLDLSALGNAGMIRFMGDFAEALYQLKAAHREALHLVLDEADLFVPQRSGRGEERVLRAFDDIVRRGRTRGLGTTLITQRSAAINKNVLTQAEMLVALRMTSPQDRSAVDDWVKAHGTPEQRDQMMSSLPSLPVGTAWAWSPGWLGVLQRIKVRRRETFDSSSTPKVGERIEVPTALADAELAALRDRFAAAVTEVEPNNPDDLRRELRQLRAQVVRQRPSGPSRSV
jgi:DNA helicase HerA-like ATPase